MEFTAIGVVILCAACLQGSVGFGLGMIAAPVLALLRPDLIPSTLLLLAVVTSFAAFFRERRETEWKLVLWAVVGRLPGIVVGTLVVVMLPPSGLSLLLATTVLGGVAFNLVGWAPLPVPRNVVIASGVSGLFGTATSIGGPPIALVMRSLPPSRMRATMSAYFVFGSLLSLTGLLLGGKLGTQNLLAAAALAPFMLLGLVLSSFVIRRVSARMLHPIAVGASVVGALLVIAEVLLELVPG